MSDLHFKQSNKINIYLDLDETLIFSIDIRRKKVLPTIIEKFKHHNFDNEYIIMERPGLQAFLDWLFKYFNVSVWSAASPDYVDFIVKHVVIGDTSRKIKRVLNSDNCDKSQMIYGEDFLKKLQMLWEVYKLPNHSAENTILLDDLWLNVKAQPENSLRIKKFLGKDDNDSEFLKIKSKLEDVLVNYKTKRKIDKSPVKRVKRASKKSPK